MQPLEEHDPLRIGEYELLGRLGGGGMGRVYLGRSPAGRKVAVKVVNEALARDPEFRERFRIELAAAGRVHAFFTASVLRADPEAAQPWMATAYIQGPSLQQRVTENGPLPASQVAELAAGVAEALTEIHAAGIVHRDLKPSNVMLSPDGPRVIDFGVARAAEGTAVTATGTFTGSALFMSPEQAQGEDVGPATDVFSLGALLFWAATGRPVFGTGQLPAVMYRVVHHEPDLSPVADPALRSLIAACLAKQPADRPGAAQVLAQAAILLTPEAEPITDRRVTPAPARDFAYRPAAAVTGGGSTGVGPSPFDAAASEDTVVRAAINASDEPGWTRRRVLLASGAAAVAVVLVAAGVTVLLRHPHDQAAPVAARPSPTVTAAPVVVPSATPTPTPTATKEATPSPTPKKTAAVRQPVAGSLLFASRFTGKDGAAWSSSWAPGRNPDSGSGGGAAIEGGMGRLATSDLGGYAGGARIARRAKIPDTTNVDVRFSFMLGHAEVYPAVVVRGNSALDTRDGDYLYIGTDGTYAIGRDTDYKDSGALPAVGDGTNKGALPLVPGKIYDAHFAADGHDLYGSVWPASGREPAQWVLHVRDPGSVRAGVVGFSVGGGKAAAPSYFRVDDVAIRRISR